MKEPYDHIDDYINGLLSEEDRAAFEVHLASNPDLKLAVENHDVAMDIVGSLIEDEVRGVLEGKDSSSYTTNLNNSSESIRIKNIKSFNLNSLLKIAAAACIIGFCCFWIIGNMNQNSLEENIYANYYEKPLNEGTRGGLEINQTKIDSIILYFDLNENRLSLSMIEQLPSQNQDSVIFKYHIHNLYNLNKHKDLIELATNNSSRMTVELKEILLYSFLLTGQKEKAKSILNQLSVIRRDRLSSLF